jgi:hypothetical protein
MQWWGVGRNGPFLCAEGVDLRHAKNDPIFSLHLTPPRLRTVLPFGNFMVTNVPIIIMKLSLDRDNNYCHYVILRNAGFAITTLSHYCPFDLYF